MFDQITAALVNMTQTILQTPNFLLIRLAFQE